MRYGAKRITFSVLGLLHISFTHLLVRALVYRYHTDLAFASHWIRRSGFLYEFLFFVFVLFVCVFLQRELCDNTFCVNEVKISHTIKLHPKEQHTEETYTLNSTICTLFMQGNSSCHGDKTEPSTVVIVASFTYQALDVSKDKPWASFPPSLQDDQQGILLAEQTASVCRTAQQQRGTSKLSRPPACFQ